MNRYGHRYIGRYETVTLTRGHARGPVPSRPVKTFLPSSRTSLRRPEEGRNETRNRA